MFTFQDFFRTKSNVRNDTNMYNINYSRDGRYVGRDIPVCESGGKRRLRFVSGMPGRSRAIDGRTDALQAQTALGVFERDA